MKRLLIPLSLAWMALAIGCVGKFVDRTSSRLSLATVPASDGQEKDVATGDLNRDGRQDVIVARKRPFVAGSGGGRSALLLINEAGRLRDRTSNFTDWDDAGREMDARDVYVGDLTGDNWPDVVFVNTSGEQPRIYVNRRRTGFLWNGLRDETSTRFPTVQPRVAGAPTVLQFCAVAAGDIDGDGDKDLYFSNYSNSGPTGDVLLINNGGTFVDQTAARLGNRSNVAFGTAVELLDLDSDGDIDIIKSSTKRTEPPWPSKGQYVLYNNGAGQFTSSAFVRLSAPSPYMFAAGDFNGDSLVDVYQVDDAKDHLTLARPPVGSAPPVLSMGGPLDITPLNGLGGNIKASDLDGDGDLDLGIASVDVEIMNCPGSEQFQILANMGPNAQANGLPQFLLAAPAQGSDSWKENVHDFVFVDIDRDGRKDIFLALCDGYKVLMKEGRGSGMSTP